LEGFCKKAARIRAAFGRDGEFQRSSAGMRIGGVDLRKHALPVLNNRGRVARSRTAGAKTIVRLPRKRDVANRSRRPVVIETGPVVEAETIQVAGLIALLSKGCADRTHGKSERRGLGHQSSDSRDRDGILPRRS